MKKILCLLLALTMIMTTGLSFSFADDENHPKEGRYKIVFDVTDSSGNAVTSVKPGAVLNVSMKLVNNDIGENDTYRIWGLMYDLDYDKSGLTVTEPKGVFSDQINVTMFDDEYLGTFIRFVYSALSNERLEAKKTESMGSFTITVGNDAYDSYDFTMNSNLLYEEFTDMDGYLIGGDGFSFKVQGGKSRTAAAEENKSSSGSGSDSKSGSGSAATTTTTTTSTATAAAASASTTSKVSLNKNYKEAYLSGYDAGSGQKKVSPNNNITRAEVAKIIYTLLSDETMEKYSTSNNTFTDVAGGAWYNSAVSTLANAGIINGSDTNGDGKMEFRPNDYITRAELTKILSAFADKNGTESVKFSDVTGHWAESFITKAASLGWVKGSDTNNDGVMEFRPNAKITRAETAAIINRIIERTGTATGTNTFIDNTNTSAWYYNDIQLAANTYNK